MARIVRQETTSTPITLDQAIRLIARTHLDLTELIGLWADHLTIEQRAALAPIRNRLIRFLVSAGWEE